MSKQKLDQYLAAPAQSTLIIGESGIGFQGVLEYIRGDFQDPYIVRSEKGTITAEIIRTLYDVTRGINVEKRLIVIDDADHMSLAAQNAFLKLLEEPSPSTYFLLLSHNPSQLLPTIHSRVETHTLTPLSTEQSQQLLDELKVTDVTKRQQLLFIAEGLPALMTMLAQDEKAFESRAQVVRDARTLLQGSNYEKLKVISQYKDRAGAQALLADAGRFLKQHASQTNVGQLIKKLDSVMKSYERIEANGNIRLWLTMAVV